MPDETRSSGNIGKREGLVTIKSGKTCECSASAYTLLTHMQLSPGIQRSTTRYPFMIPPYARQESESRGGQCRDVFPIEVLQCKSNPSSMGRNVLRGGGGVRVTLTETG